MLALLILTAAGLVLYVHVREAKLRAWVEAQEPRALQPTPRVQVTRQSVRDLEQAVADLQDRIANLNASGVALPTRGQTAPSSRLLAPEAEAEPPDFERLVSDAFMEWCRSRGPLAAKMDLFAQFLLRSVPHTSVERVFHDRNSSLRPLRFDRGGAGTPAEYWLVDVEGLSLLLPMPQGPAQFRDLSAFEGRTTPATVSTFRPARLLNDGAMLTLTQPGQIG